MKIYSCPQRPLVLALIAGLSANASLAGLTDSRVMFSIFPLLTLFLAATQLYQSYFQSESLANNGLKKCVLSFFTGVFGYSAMLRVDHPDMGSNFIPLMIALILATYLFITLSKESDKTAEAEQ